MPEDRTQAEIDEVRRDRVVWTTLIILGLLAAAGAMALGWRVVEGRLSAAKQLDQAIAALKQTDPTMIAIDEVIRAEVSTQTAARSKALAPRVETARAQLAGAAKLAASGRDKLTDDEQEQATLVEAAANARIAMLESAPVLLAATSSASEARGLSETAWAKTLAADQLARQAVADYNKLKKADVKNASATNDQAKTAFTEARGLFQKASTVFPQAGLDVYIAYLDGRIAMVGIAKQVDSAWLAGKVAHANKLRASYNKKDAEAAAGAKELPPSPANSVAEAYKALADAPTSAYFKARQKAAEADNALRNL